MSFEKTEYNVPPNKFEAGTPHIVGAIGLGAVVDYLEEVGMDLIEAHEQDLLAYATECLEAIDGVRIIGNARHKASVLSFVIEGVHAHDVGDHSRPAGRRRAGRAPLRAAGDGAFWRRPPRRGRPWLSTTPAKRSTSWYGPSGGYRRFSTDGFT